MVAMLEASQQLNAVTGELLLNSLNYWFYSSNPILYCMW